MRSSRPKPLHLLCGRPLILHVIDALAELQVERVVVVVGHGAERVTKTLHELAPPNLLIDFVEQHVQRGTGDAVSVALTAFPDDDFEDGDIVVLPGDAPLLRPPTLAALVRRHRAADAAATILSAELQHPEGYSRIVRAKDDRVRSIVDDMHLEEEDRDVHEIATSVYCFRRSVLAPSLRRLTPENVHGEYYLTDVVGVLHDAGYPVVTMVLEDPTEAAGVNDRDQLAAAEAELRDRTNQRWMRRGVTMVDPQETYIDAAVTLAPDVTLFPGTILQGSTVVAAGAEIGPYTRLVDCVVGEGAAVENSVGRFAEIGAQARVGPFAHLAPGARVAPGAVTGPYFTAGDEEEQT
ncbi:MAG: bifunctional UDP-N-acetylglucosamine pyrophosphorylase / glucosamine-phosphate N-acetyltransferase [Actinomycetota bacterium]|jgi:bifunctional UDP-N-acetylglucosamine pyrophosphorylase/glucosamine-1-phosphate N-acetyltransferase